MDRNLVAGISVVVLAIVLGLIGGWVVAGSGAVPKRLRAVHLTTGALLIMIAVQSANRVRLSGVVRDEEVSATALRTITIGVGILVLLMHVRRHRQRVAI